MPKGATRDETAASVLSEEPTPGVVLVSCAGVPRFEALSIPASGLELGRFLPSGEELADDRISRAHAMVSVDEGGFVVRDLGSRNGTFVDGQPVQPLARPRAPFVLRLGHTLLLGVPSVRPYQVRPLRREGGFVIGPVLGSVLEEVERAAQHVESLLVTGESGAGKELAARAFHQRGPHAKGPFVAINAATIPEGVAERLLFGAKRGAFSGADQDAEGYLQAADGGVLFLDELIELSTAVQAKLLRVLQTKEVLAVGASRPRKVDVRFCGATHGSLRAAMKAGRFRPDLFYRVAQAEVRVPPLRERREEIPWLVAQALRELGPAFEAHGRFVERCLLAVWPGNVRELLTAVRRAALTAQAANRASVRIEDMPTDIGESSRGATPIASSPPSATAKSAPPPAADTSDTNDEVSEADRRRIEEALANEQGNVAAAARALGMHRTQLYRVMRRYGLR